MSSTLVIDQQEVIDFVNSHFRETFSEPIYITSVSSETIGFKLGDKEEVIETSIVNKEYDSIDLETKILWNLIQTDSAFLIFYFNENFNDKDNYMDFVEVHSSTSNVIESPYDFYVLVDTNALLENFNNEEIVIYAGAEATESFTYSSDEAMSMTDLRKRARLRKLFPKKIVRSLILARTKRIDPVGYRKRSRAAKLRWIKYGTKIRRGIRRFSKSNVGKRLRHNVGIIRRDTNK